MMVSISLDKKFNCYKEFSATLDEIALDPKFQGFVSLEHPLASQYFDKGKHKNKLKVYGINWADINGSDNIKTNRFGKQYNADAPLIAAKSLVASSTHIIEFGKGDYNINKLAKGVLEPVKIDKKVIGLEKRYKF